MMLEMSCCDIEKAAARTGRCHLCLKRGEQGQLQACPDQQGS